MNAKLAKDFLLTADKVLSAEPGDDKRLTLWSEEEVWESAFAFADWGTEPKNCQSPLAFLGAFCLLSLVNCVRPRLLDERILRAELSASILYLSSPYHRAVQRLDCLGSRFEKSEWNEEISMRFASDVQEAWPLFKPFFRNPFIAKLRDPYIRKASGTRNIFERIVAKGRADYSDHIRLNRGWIGFYDLGLHFRDQRYVTISPALVLKRKHRYHHLQKLDFPELEMYWEDEQVLRDSTCVLSALDKVERGDLSLVGRVLESLSGWEGDSASRWVASVAYRASKDGQDLLGVLGDSLRAYRPPKEKERGNFSMTSGQREWLKDWYEAKEGRPISRTVMKLRKFFRAQKLTDSISSKDWDEVPQGIKEELNEDRRRLAELIWPLRHIFLNKSMVPCHFAVLYGYFEKRRDFSFEQNHTFDFLLCRAHQAWRELYPRRKRKEE